MRLTTGEFENMFTKIVKSFDLGGNNWVWALYEYKDKWVECYFRGNYFGGMHSTKRYERILYSMAI